MSYINVQNLANNLSLALVGVVGQPVQLTITECAVPSYMSDFRLECESNELVQSPRVVKSLTIALSCSTVKEEKFQQNEMRFFVGYHTESFDGGENYFDLAHVTYNANGDILAFNSLQHEGE